MAKFKGSTFQVGDTIEVTERTLEVGILEFKEGESIEVLSLRVDGSTNQVLIYNPYDLKTHWYAESHFKLKENSVESNENHFKVGQTVWDVVYGKGEVVIVLQNVLKYPVVVKFVDGTRHFTEDGKLDEKYARTLFFSEPKIIAETKSLFEPTLKDGDLIVVKHVKQDWKYLLQVCYEDEDVVWVNGEEDGYLKSAWNFYKLGEKIEFN